MEEAHVERRLGAVLKPRIAERLRAEAVQRADLAGVVAEQVDVVAVIGFIGGAGEHGQGRDFFAIGHANKALAVPRREGLFDHHLFSLEVFTLGHILARQRLDDHGQMNERIDPQRGEEVVPQIIPRYGWQLQVVGAWRVLGEVLAGEFFLLFQQCGHGVVLLREKLLQGLNFDLRGFAQGRQILQRQVAADRMVGPAPGCRGRCAQQQQEKCQLHCF